MKRNALLLLPILILSYVGPYAYVYAMTEADVFPRVERGDHEAIGKMSVRVDNQARMVIGQSFARTVGTDLVEWTEVTYEVLLGFNNRIFTTYINFPALLDVSKITFKATGIFNGTAIMTCSQYYDSLVAPTGFEILAVFQSILLAGNNTFVNAFCYGPGAPTVDYADLSVTYLGLLPITLSWEIRATVRGERAEETRTWSGVQSAIIRFR